MNKLSWTLEFSFLTTLAGSEKGFLCKLFIVIVCTLETFTG